MSQINKLSALLASDAIKQVADTGVDQLAIAGLRVQPFRAALGLLLAGIRVKKMLGGSSQAPRRKSGGGRRPKPCRRAPRTAQSGKGGSYHG